MYEVDITLVTVTSVLCRMLKASATDFGSEICKVLCFQQHMKGQMTRTCS
jgi:hypothetical protein